MSQKITEIPTPYYLFNEKRFATILETYQQIGDVYYPVKANDDDLIVEAAIKNSCCFEVDSIAHIRMLVNEKGVDASRILYSYPIREEKDIKEAVILGIKKFVVDSIDEYVKINRYLDDGEFLIRLNVVDILGSDLPPHKNKWGLSVQDAQRLIKKINYDGKPVLGISFYLFEDIAKPKMLKLILKKVSKEFAGFSLKCLNIGGGFSAQELAEFKNLIDDTRLNIGAERIIVEPGRFLLNPCIDMIVSVIAIKKVGASRLVFINAGIYSGLIDVVIKGRRFDICDFEKESIGNYESTLVCGDSSDVSDFLGEYELRSNLKVRDQLMIKECGSYSNVMQTNFYKKGRIEMKVEDRIC